MNENRKENRAVYTPQNCVASGSILLYMDNSEVFASAKNYSGINKGYLEGTPDYLCRIDTGKLIAKAIGQREILLGKLYGSVPAALDTVWQGIRRQQIQLEVLEGCDVRQGFREMNTTIVADGCCDLIEYKEQAGENRTLILFSGHRDFIPLVKKALKYDYFVEIWAFSTDINKHVDQMASECPNRIKVRLIDDIFRDVTFTLIQWGRQQFPTDKCVVASFSLPENWDRRSKQAFFRDFVEIACTIFYLPMLGKPIENYGHIVLIPISQDSTPERNCWFDFRSHIQPHMQVLQEHFAYVCTQVVSLKMFREQRKEKLAETVIASQDKLEVMGISEEDHYDSDEESGIFDIHNNNNNNGGSPDVKLGNPDENMLMADTEYFLDSKIVFKKEVNSYGMECDKKFWCRHGLKCIYKHTNKEREYFMAQPESRKRHTYKTKPCYYIFAKKGACDLMDQPELCPYAHNVTEARCLCCGGRQMESHWMDQCPYKVIRY